MRKLYIPDPNFQWAPEGVIIPTYLTSPAEDIQDTTEIEEEQPKRIVKRQPKQEQKTFVEKPVQPKSAATFTTPTNNNNFNLFKKHYFSVNHKDQSSRFDFFAKLAQAESSFNPSAQNSNSGALGYFQFMEGKTNKGSWDNITRYANTDRTTFKNNPTLQIEAMHRMVDDTLSRITPEDLQLAKQKGYTLSALVAGAHFGGMSGMRRYLKTGKSASDRHWSKTNAGTDVAKRMQEFNNFFKSGGKLW